MILNYISNTKTRSTKELKLLYLKGNACVDRKTKNLSKRIQPGDIAVISHPDLDEVAAQSLVEARVKAVINADYSVTGKYPNQGPKALLDAGIVLLDNAGQDVLKIKDGQEIVIAENKIYANDKLLAKGNLLDYKKLDQLMLETHKNLNNELNKFVDNTLTYALKEKELILNNDQYPQIKTTFRNKHVVIVVRGRNYKEDLIAIKPYLNEIKPVLVAVDGGADALIDLGYTPQLIIGDMDSISDRALQCGAELLVHAYLDGNAPGISRVERLGLSYKKFPVLGTSEDAALLLAHAKGAELIVAVGTHTNMIDFLEKGRPGMASTLLTRIKVGSKLVDAKGVSKLYRPKVYFGHLAQVLIAGLIPIFIISSISPIFNQFWRILILKIRLLIRI